MKVPKHKITHVPDGIYPDFFVGEKKGLHKTQLGIATTKKIVIYTGSLMKSKGIDYLLDAIPEIAHQYRNVHFVLVGYPVESSKKRVKDLKVENLVSFTGKVNYFDLPKYLAFADVAVDPKPDDACEGSGKIVNYMGAGLPVVCFNTLNNRAVLSGSGFFATPGNPKDLANKVVELLKNGAMSKRIGGKNWKRANELFSWNKSGEKVSQIYLKVKQRK